MKRRLILFRHGKSDWDGDIEADHDRPLAGRGRKAAKRMGKLLARSGQTPDLAVTSTALRARATVEQAAKAGDWSCAIVEDRALYDTEPGAVLERIRSTDDAVGTLLLAGHEPTWSDLASLLIGGGNIRFPTAAMARIDFLARSWKDVRPGEGELVWLLQPRFFTNTELEEGR